MANDQITMNVLDQQIELTGKMAEFFSAIMGAMSQSARYDEASAKGVKAILKEIQEGRQPRTDIVDAQDAEVFRELLKVYNVPYMEVEFTDAQTGKQRAAFLTREYDRRAMDEIRERFLYEMNMGCSELDVDAFIRNNEGQDIRSYKNLDAAEVELFRQHASAENVSYAIINDAKYHKKYEILYLMRDKTGIDNALLKTSYEFSGERGKEYKSKITNAISRKKAFDRQLQPEGSETMFVVDSQNPRNFISVNRNGFILHSLENAEQKRFDGSTENIILDKNTVSFSSYDRDKLMNYVGKMRKPVILSADEMSIVSSISNTGEAILPSYNEFKRKFDALSKDLSNRTDYYNGRVVKERIKGPEKVHTLINIPSAVQTFAMDVIKNSNLHETVVSGGCIAYSEKEKAVVERTINAELYRGMNPTQKLEAKVFYEGRGMLNIDDTEKTQYILNADSPDYVMKLDESGLTIMNKGKETGHVDRTGEFAKTVTDLIYTIENPVVLQKEEMEVAPEKRIENIISHLPSNQKNSATEYLQNMEEHEMEELCKIPKNDTTHTHLSDRQKEALANVTRFETQEYHVSRNLIEKIEDHTKSPKTVRENRTYEEEITH